jgi:hypothetical protein
MNETTDTLPPPDRPSSAPSGSAQCPACAGAGEVYSCDAGGAHMAPCATCGGTRLAPDAYVHYGPEWAAHLAKTPKKFIIALLRSACIELMQARVALGLAEKRGVGEPYSEEFLERYDAGVKHAQAVIRLQEQNLVKEFRQHIEGAVTLGEIDESTASYVIGVLEGCQQNTELSSGL